MDKVGKGRSANSGTDKMGKSAEEIACKFLEERGFIIIERNWRHHHLEVDIFAVERCHREILHLIEVKGRASSSYTEPSKLVGIVKQRNLINAARGYLYRKHLDYEVVFDLIIVIFSGGGHEISFIQNAFKPIW